MSFSNPSVFTMEQGMGRPMLLLRTVDYENLHEYKEITCVTDPCRRFIHMYSERIIGGQEALDDYRKYMNNL